MPKEEKETIKLMRSPIDTYCRNSECNKFLPFGTWVYYNPESGDSICPECAVKMGWSPKERIRQLIKALELREDLKVLRERVKVETNTLALLKEKINLQRLGERDLELEKQILLLMGTVKDYLHRCIATPTEKEGLNKIFDVIRETQELQKEVRDHIQNRLFTIERKEKKEAKKKTQTALLEE